MEKKSLDELKAEIKSAKISLTKLVTISVSKSKDEISRPYLREIISEIRERFAAVKELQKFRNNAIAKKGGAEDDIDLELSRQIDVDSDYNDKISISIGNLHQILDDMTLQITQTATPQSTVPVVSQAPIHVKLPELKIGHFSDNKNDSFDYFRFMSSFNNALDSVPNVKKSVKLVYLKSYLGGRALALVENLAIEDDSFDVAVRLLNEEFFDKDYLINETLTSIVNHKSCSTLEMNMQFISFIKAKLAELEKFQIKLLDSDSDGLILLSNIVRSKLYSPFLKELCRKLSFNYPTANNIIENASSINKLINPSGETSNSKPASSNTVKSDNEKSKSDQNSGCRFCLRTNHSSLHCKKFLNHSMRKAKALELGLCIRC